jgi:hypothetical protein
MAAGNNICRASAEGLRGESCPLQVGQIAVAFRQ